MSFLKGVEINDSLVGRKILVLTSNTKYLTEGTEYEVIRVIDGRYVDVLDNDDDRGDLLRITNGGVATWEWVPEVPVVKSTKTDRKGAAAEIRLVEQELKDAIEEAQKLGMTVTDIATPATIYFQPATPKKEMY